MIYYNIIGALEVNSHSQQRAIVNTVLSLSAATTAAFITSSLLSRYYCIIHTCDAIY